MNYSKMTSESLWLLFKLYSSDEISSFAAASNAAGSIPFFSVRSGLYHSEGRLPNNPVC